MRPHVRGRSNLPHLVLALSVLSSALLACGVPRTSGTLRQEAYVWQRDWNEGVRTAVAASGSSQSARGFAGLTVLAAQLDLRTRPVTVTPVAYDAVSLRTSGLPVGFALRFDPFPGRFGDRPDIVAAVRAAALDALARARASGLTPAELQLDYDSPVSKLEDYRLLLEDLRLRIAPIPLTLTTLPSWLDREGAFKTLIAAADGYVLQVHSLSPPRHPEGDDGFVLCRPDEARAWVERAARFGLPFRVALPTYSYVAAFDGRGQVLALAAEGVAPQDGPDAHWRPVRADPAAMAGLVRGWTGSRPASMQGIVWYRLPVPDDRLNWSATTLGRVRAGLTPRRDLRIQPAQADPSAPALVEIELWNAGEADEAWPERISLRWAGDPPLALDALGGYRFESGRTGARLVSERAGTPRILRPGDRRKIAWLRFSAPQPVFAE